MQYAGMKKVEIPAGMILTPAAKDWAAEHGLEVVMLQGGACQASACAGKTEDEKTELLKRVLKSVRSNMNQSGGLLTREELVKIVASSLERMGCTVENK